MDKLEQQVSEYKKSVEEGMTGYDEIVHKRYDSGVFSKFHTADDKREFIATVTTNQVDSDGDVMDPRGADLKRFQQNPIIFLNHEAWTLPIGKALWIRRFTDQGKSGILSKGFISDKTERAKEAFGLMQDGILTAVSIGFGVKPGGAREPTEDELRKFPGIKRMVSKWELFEYSVVGIPANTEAVIQQVSKMKTIPDWLDIDIPDVDLKQREPDHVALNEPVCLVAPVKMTKRIKMERKLTDEELANIASEQAADLYERKTLGRV